MEKEQPIERLEKHLHDLKQRDPLQGIPQSNRCAIATLRLVDSLLWLAYHMPAFRSTMSEEEMRNCMKTALQDTLFHFLVLCQAFGINATTLQVRAKYPHDLLTDREERLAQLNGWLLDQCWSHCRAFTPEHLQDSKNIQKHEVGIQLGCTWYTLQELATQWNLPSLIEILLESTPTEGI